MVRRAVWSCSVLLAVLGGCGRVGYNVSAPPGADGGSMDARAGVDAASDGGREPADVGEGVDAFGCGDLCASDLGRACGRGTDCAGGYCVDGVCCDGPCEGTCESCADTSGKRDGTCAFAHPGTDPDGDCPGPATCNGAGGCGARALGVPCATGPECESGYCVEELCCNTPCSDACTSCLGKRTGGDDGVCTLRRAGSNPDGACSPYLCNGVSASCPSDCFETSDCTDEYHCAAGVCVATSGNGTLCTSGAECGSGHCADGVCCTGPCVEQCNACVASSTGGDDGICGFIRAGTDPDSECPAAMTCNGAGGCT